MTKTEVQLLSKAQAVEIKAYAVAGTTKERVEWFSQHTDYIRANRPSYYVSDAQGTKILDADDVRNELARINLPKNTRYKPTRYNISFNYIANPPLHKRSKTCKVEYNSTFIRLCYHHTDVLFTTIQTQCGYQMQLKMHSPIA